MCIRDSPVRDFVPRLSHYILPIPGKGDSNFGYSWIPVIGPLTGGVLGVTVYEFLFENIENIYLYLSVGIFLLVSTLSIIESKN